MRFSNRPLFFGALYCLASCVWIILSDKFLAQLSLSPGAASAWSIAKGLFYVAVSGGLFFLTLRRLQKTNENLEAIVQARTSELARTEQELRHSQKMEALGRLAGGIAHDFNNMLMVIRTYSELLRDENPENEGVRSKTEAVMLAVDRAASLTSQLLTFSRKQIVAPAVLNLNDLVADTSKLLRRLIGEDVRLVVHADEGLWPVKMDPGQMVQVLMNLCVNARDAMPSGGTLAISTRNLLIEVSGGDVAAPLHPGEYVVIAVADNGSGMSREVKDRIFDPFFTTKEVGRGSGLGLSIVYGIVEQGGGHISVQSTPGSGTCFTIYLPRTKEEAPCIVPAREPVKGGTASVLVVEDEEALRIAICEYLRELGYKTLAAESGDHALAVACKHQIDVLVTDVVMPKMSGTELVDELSRRIPEFKVIYMSGYTSDALLQNEIEKNGACFLQKPFSMASLARTLRTLTGPAETGNQS